MLKNTKFFALALLLTAATISASEAGSAEGAQGNPPASSQNKGADDASNKGTNPDDQNPTPETTGKMDLVKNWMTAHQKQLKIGGGSLFVVAIAAVCGWLVYKNNAKKQTTKASR